MIWNIKFSQIASEFYNCFVNTSMVNFYVSVLKDHKTIAEVQWVLNILCDTFYRIDLSQDEADYICNSGLLDLIVECLNDQYSLDDTSFELWKSVCMVLTNFSKMENAWINYIIETNILSQVVSLLIDGTRDWEKQTFGSNLFSQESVGALNPNFKELLYDLVWMISSLTKSMKAMSCEPYYLELKNIQAFCSQELYYTTSKWIARSTKYKEDLGSFDQHQMQVQTHKLQKLSSHLIWLCWSVANMIELYEDLIEEPASINSFIESIVQ